MIGTLIVCILLISVSLRVAFSLDLRVDPDMTTRNGATYPSLDQAISALLNGSQLMDDENTITLTANCAGKNHFFPQCSNSLSIDNTISGRGGSLTIVFENTPQSAGDANSCRQLPTLVLSLGYCLAAGNLRLLNITGLHIQFLGDKYVNVVTDVNVVTFYSFCFNNSEPVETSLVGKYRWFEINNVATLSMINGVYIYDARKGSLISNTKQVFLNNVTFVSLVRQDTNEIMAVSVVTNSSIKTDVIMDNLKVVCVPNYIVMPNIFQIEKGGKVLISSMSMSDCNLSGATAKSKGIIVVLGASNLTVQGATLYNLKLVGSYDSYRTIIVSSDVDNSIFSNFSIMNLVFDNPRLGQQSSQVVFFQYQFQSVSFDGWNMINCTFARHNMLIHSYFSKEEQLGLVTIENFNLTNSSLNEGSNLIYMKVEVVNNSTKVQDLAHIKMRNIHIAKMDFNSSVMFYLSYASSSYIAAIELLQLEVTSLKMSSCSLFQSSIIQAKGICTSISDIVVESVGFISASNFYASKRVLSTLLISTASFKDMEIRDFSSFISANIVDARPTGLDKSMDGGIGIFAETRPFLVYNCSFDSIYVESNSYFFVSTNPMIIVQQNNFTDCETNNSGFLKLGNYPFFLSPQSNFIGIDGKFDSYPGTPNTLLANRVAESAIFNERSDLGIIYESARAAISDYSSGGAIFFIWINRNTVNNASFANTSHLFEITKFEIPNGTVVVSNNSFANLSSTEYLNLVGGSAILSGIFLHNIFSAVSVIGYAFSFTSSYFDLFLLDSNMIFGTSRLAFCSINSKKCKTILINSTMVSNITSEQTFIAIFCDIIDNDVTIEGSTFQNLYQINTPEVLNSLSFISMISRKSSLQENSRYVLKNNYFLNSTLNNMQGYTQGIYRNSFIFMLALATHAQFKNNSFNNIVTKPKGNLMTISLPEIIFSGCNFKNISFGSADGAIHTVFENILIHDCFFIAIQSLSTDGAGLFKLTNPKLNEVPLRVLRVDVQNTTFRNNVAPYGTVFNVQDSAIIFTLNTSVLTNNQLTKTGGILTLQNVALSNVSITNSNFTQNQGYYYPNYPPLKLIYFDSSGSAGYVQLAGLRIDIIGNVKGSFISLSGPRLIKLLGTSISYSAGSDSYSTGSDSSSPQFGFFEGDNFDAVFTDLHISNISLGQIGMFVLNTPNILKGEGKWFLLIQESKFEDMNLTEAIITVNSNGPGSTALVALDNLSIIIQNSFARGINWRRSSHGLISSSNGLISSSNGLISSSIQNIGRSSNKTDFAITIVNCSFVDITGSTGLIISMIEPVFESVVLIKNCHFSLISSSGPGAIVNPSIDALSNFTSHTTHNDTPDDESKRKPTFVIIGNSFETISSSSGAIFYWKSTSKGTSIFSEGNSFRDINCSEDGGIIFGSYLPRNPLLINMGWEQTLNVVSRDDTIFNVSESQNGGIIYVEGVSQFINIFILNITVIGVSCSGNGSVVCVISPKFTFHSPKQPRLAENQLSQHSKVGTINISGSTISSITAQSGGIIYENTPGDTVSLVFDSNLVENVSVSGRGGAFYLVKPIISINSNIFENVNALAGPIIYSVSDQINLTNFEISNVINPPPSMPFYSVESISLHISFIPLDGSLPITLEYQDTAPYYRTASRLTSYSLSQYQINLTLVSNGFQTNLPVYDQSTDKSVSLDFISNRGSIQRSEGKNCSTSSCIVNASAITLKGLADELILVNASYHSEFYNPFQQFYIRLRGCQPGEFNNTRLNECTYCNPGTYSLTSNSTKCSECPTGAICKGGTEIIINEGFFRSNIASANLHIINCNDSGRNGWRCSGGANNSCLEPFSGPVCLQCDRAKGYVMNANSGSCTKCLDKSTLFVVSAALLIVTVAYQIMMTIVTFKENKKAHMYFQKHKKELLTQPGRFFVLLSTYTQIITIVSSLDEGGSSSLFNIINVVGNPYHQVVVSFQCLCQEYNPDPLKALQVQVLTYVLSPLIKVLVVMIIEFLRNLIWRDSEGQTRKKSLVRVGAVAVVLIWLEQPGIVGILCKYLTWTKLDPFDDETYIKTHNSISCSMDGYSSFKRNVVIPALTFWAFIIPLGIFVLLYKIRHKLFIWQSLRIIFGIFYNGYSEKSYYWGVLILIFKLTIYVLNAILKTPLVIKGYIFMAIIQFYFFLLKRKTPYLYKYLYLADKYCCMAYIITLILEFIKLGTESSGIKEACRVLGVITIVFAGCYMVLIMLWLYSLTLLEMIRKCKRQQKQKQTQQEILELLRVYHNSHPSHIDRHHRRGGICITLPERLRNKEEHNEEMKGKGKRRKDERRTSKSMISQKISRIFSSSASLESHCSIELSIPDRRNSMNVVSKTSIGSEILNPSLKEHEISPDKELYIKT